MQENIGPLSFHADDASFMGEVMVGASAISVTVYIDASDAADATARVQSFLKRLESLAKAAEDHVGRTMLEKANGWQDADAPPLTEQDLRRRVRLIQTTLQRDDGGSLVFEDGDVFWGHDIVVPMNADGSFGTPSLWG
jgi:hypothetical protein